MSVSTNDLSDFHHFALAKVQNGGADSLLQLAAQWDAARSLEQSVANIRASIADASAGHFIPAETALAEARKLVEQFQ